jgi:hypothetical protein
MLKIRCFQASTCNCRSRRTATWKDLPSVKPTSLTRTALHSQTEENSDVVSSSCSSMCRLEKRKKTGRITDGMLGRSHATAGAGAQTRSDNRRCDGAALSGVFIPYMRLCFPSLTTREQYSLALLAPEFGSNKEEDKKNFMYHYESGVQVPDSEFRRVAATKIRRSSPNSLLDRKRRTTLSIVHCFPLPFSHSSCAFFGSRRKLQKSLTTNEKNSNGRKESVPQSQAQTGSIKCSLRRGLSDSPFLQIPLLVSS